MRTITCGILAMIICLAVTAPIFAGGYKITKVIDVGPADLDPMVWPLKWSPDGTKLAYFYDGVLNICDTLGKNLTVIPFNIHPYRYDWLSNYELVIYLKERSSGTRGPSDYNRLVRVDIASRQQDVLEEYTRGTGYHPDGDPKSFSGPALTVEGNLFYMKNVLGRLRNGAEYALMPKSLYRAKGSMPLLKDDHLLTLTRNGIFLMRGDMTDSVQLWPRPDPYIPMTPLASHDLSHIMICGRIFRLPDSSIIDLDSIIRQSLGLACLFDFLYYSFNPNYPEVLFNFIREGDDENEIFGIGTYNYATNNFEVLDSLAGQPGGKAPACAPDGLKIAFLHQSRLYIVYRSGTP